MTEVTYEIIHRNIPHPTGGRVIYQIATVYPGGQQHISSDGGDDFRTFDEAQMEIERRQNAIIRP